ncbi:DUF5753 domain-containing protein, partial [Actinomadura adrarensis]
TSRSPGRLRCVTGALKPARSRSPTAVLEADASRVRIFAPQVVHGLMQTEEYARIMIRGSGMALRSAPDVETEVQFRLGRQRLHQQPRPPLISVVLGEAAVRQMIGGAEVMRRQARKLLSMRGWPHIELQVLPFSVREHPGGDGAFTIMSLGHEAVLEVVTLHSLTRSWYVDEPSDVEHYSQTFATLQTSALPESDSYAMIERIVSGL